MLSDLPGNECSTMPGILLPQSQPVNKSAVSLGVRPAQIRKETPLFSYHPVNRMSGMSILRIQLEMLRQPADPLGKQCHLDLDRSRITFFDSVLGDDLPLLLFVQFSKLPHLIV